MQTLRLPEPGEAGASSNVAAIGWCEPSQVLEVEFHNGSTYHYYRVEKALWEAFQQATSKGGFIHAHLKGRHYQQIKPARTSSPQEAGLQSRPQDNPRPADKMRRKPKSEDDEQTKFLAVFARNGHSA